MTGGEVEATRSAPAPEPTENESLTRSCRSETEGRDHERSHQTGQGGVNCLDQFSTTFSDRGAEEVKILLVFGRNHVFCAARRGRRERV